MNTQHKRNDTQRHRQHKKKTQQIQTTDNIHITTQQTHNSNKPQHIQQINNMQQHRHNTNTNTYTYETSQTDTHGKQTGTNKT